MPDYFAPTFNVKVSGATLAAEVTAYIVQLSVDLQPDSLATFSLTVANPFPQMPWTHVTPTLFQEGNEINIEMGYVGRTCPMVSGDITKVDASFPESGSPTINVNGYSALHRLRGAAKSRQFDKQSDKEVVEFIAQEHHLRASVEDAGIRYEHISQVQQDDLGFVLQRGREIGFELLSEGKDLIFRRRQPRQQDAFTFRWGEVQELTDTPAEILPLKSFSPTINTAAQVTKVIVRGGRDPKTGQQYIGTAGPTPGGAQRSGAEVVQAAFGETREEVISTEPFPSQAAADARALAEYQARAREFVTGIATSIGVPELRPGVSVVIKGLGPKFSGQYYVVNTLHSIGGSGYETSFHVQRDQIT